MSDLAKGIIDSLKTESEIDHAHHASELHKHATHIANRVHSGEPHTAEVLAAFEHAYMLMQSLGMTDSVDPDHDGDNDAATPEPVREEVENNELLPEGHRFATLRPNQLAKTYTGGRREVFGFVDSFETLEEAYGSAKDWKLRPVYLVEVVNVGDKLTGTLKYILTPDADKETSKSSVDSPMEITDIGASS